jgi:hypothetical protein
MLTGKIFRLKAEILGVETISGQRHAVHIPQGDTVTVLSGPKPDDKRMIDVRWRDKQVVLFAEDMQTRGEQIGDSTKT